MRMPRPLRVACLILTVFPLMTSIISCATAQVIAPEPVDLEEPDEDQGKAGNPVEQIPADAPPA